MVDARKSLARWVRILCTFALICIGFAHQPPVVGAYAASQVDLAQYAFPDGSLPVLCLPDADSDSGDATGSGSGCAACRLSAGLILPAPADMAGIPLPRPADPVALPRSEAFARLVLPPNAPPRAPPVGPVA